jgi:hypothetical protein
MAIENARMRKTMVIVVALAGSVRWVGTMAEPFRRTAFGPFVAPATGERHAIGFPGNLSRTRLPF